MFVCAVVVSVACRVEVGSDGPTTAKARATAQARQTPATKELADHRIAAISTPLTRVSEPKPSTIILSVVVPHVSLSPLLECCSTKLSHACPC